MNDFKKVSRTRHFFKVILPCRKTITALSRKKVLVFRFFMAPSWRNTPNQSDFGYYVKKGHGHPWLRQFTVNIHAVRRPGRSLLLLLGKEKLPQVRPSDLLRNGALHPCFTHSLGQNLDTVLREHETLPAMLLPLSPSEASRRISLYCVVIRCNLPDSNSHAIIRHAFKL